jgi:predicted transcriptional regulator
VGRRANRRAPHRLGFSMSDQPLLVRDVMRIGVPTCKATESVVLLAQQMVEHAWTAVVVMDDDGDARGWINERMLAVAYVQGSAALTAADILDEDVPEAPADIPLAATVQLMADFGVDHLFFMHHAGGKTWPASVLNLRDIVKALAGPEYIRAQGMHAQRPTPMDLFRQRYGLPKK